MSLYEKLKKAADKNRLALDPLPEHCAASQAEHVRMHYALVLAALLNAQEAISEAQARLFVLLLDSLRLGDIRGALFEQVRNLQEETLIEMANIIRGAGLAQHLLVDALILLRLDEPLDEKDVSQVGELASLLGVDAENLKSCSHLAARILGLSNARSNVSAMKWPGNFHGLGKIVAPKASRPRKAIREKRPELPFWHAEWPFKTIKKR